jgi:FixJ family two-component response regulator
MLAPPSAAGPVIAIVDDNESFLTALRKILENAGFRVHAFSSALTFVDSGVLDGLDCVMLDVGMPWVNGLTLQECIRKRAPHLPIVFCSGAEEEEIAQKAMAGGAITFLRKPPSAADVVAAACQACAQKR